MKSTLLILSLVVIAILLALLWFNQQSAKAVEANRQELRQAYTDSLAAYAQSKAIIQTHIRTVEAEISAAARRDSVTKVTYKAENDRLRAALFRAKYGKVIEIIDSEPELRYYIAYYDSVNLHQEFYIDTLELQKRIASELCNSLVNKKDSLIGLVEKENAYLRGEVDRRDEIISKQDKKLRKQRWWIRALGLANLIPRGGKY